ncbi:uncharacterized protein B0I36DRAFT_365425 [Microdochium trichocladiopsis]|uniref:F-box domain-containing protein n=1 Tax=Microdochium trichocladiopsis TaxID=1682393 RepID=A0A9P8XZ29_9PEZI|nr:uncharacterized protein B0I36DRAFT_365425 [Microdochium trichocladiopsis]KAH7025758.1 hypothetical protein B0I36DRAFT_365425 [Microdochium trichocladiopsis]
MACQSPVDLLPPEIVLSIFSWLDATPPSETNLYDQPSAVMLRGSPGSVNLKQASLVSKTWRTMALPMLFEHVAWIPHVSSLSAFTLNPIPLLRFLEEQGLSRFVTTFTLLVDFVDRDAESHDLSPQIRPVDLEWLFDQIFSVLDPLRFTVIAPPTTLAAFMSRMLFLEDAWSFSIPYHVLSLSRPARVRHSDGMIHTDISSMSKKSQPPAPPPNTSRSAAQPTRTNTRGHLHISRRARPPVCPLFTIRPWTSLLLNEGSSTKVYRTYEFFLRQPPSMLSALLGCGEYPNDQPLVPASVVEFSYIAVFPLSSHFATLVRHLPRVKRLYVQLAPLEGSRAFLDDRREMSQIDPADLWMERDMSYGFVVRKMVAAANAAAAAEAAAAAASAAAADAEQDSDHYGSGQVSDSDDADTTADWAGVTGVHFGDISSVSTTLGNVNNRNWAELEVFESGDAAIDAEAWDMAVQALDHQSGSVRWWKVQDRGRIVRVKR